MTWVSGDLERAFNRHGHAWAYKRKWHHQAAPKEKLSLPRGHPAGCVGAYTLALHRSPYSSEPRLQSGLMSQGTAQFQCQCSACLTFVWGRYENEIILINLRPLDSDVLSVIQIIKISFSKFFASPWWSIFYFDFALYLREQEHVLVLKWVLPSLKKYQMTMWHSSLPHNQLNCPRSWMSGVVLVSWRLTRHLPPPRQPTAVFYYYYQVWAFWWICGGEKHFHPYGYVKAEFEQQNPVLYCNTEDQITQCQCLYIYSNRGLSIMQFIQ